MPSNKDKKIPKLKCKECGEKWVPRVSAPKKCPYCQTMDWDGSEVYRRVAGPARRAKKVR